MPASSPTTETLAPHETSTPLQSCSSKEGRLLPSHTHGPAVSQRWGLFIVAPERQYRLAAWMTNLSPFFIFVLELVVPGTLIVLLVALLWTSRT